jgi:hypothetical protein
MGASALAFGFWMSDYAGFLINRSAGPDGYSYPIRPAYQDNDIRRDIEKSKKAVYFETSVRKNDLCRYFPLINMIKKG